MINISIEISAANLLFEPLFGRLHVLEELLIRAGVLEMGFEAMGELEKPRPLSLHGRDVSLDRLSRWVVLLLGEELAALLDTVELVLALLEFVH
mgnify:FL=1